MARKTSNAKAKNGSAVSALKPRDVADLGDQLMETPFTLIRRFGDEMDRLFGDFGFGRDQLTGQTARGLWAPQIEVFERDKQLVVRADLAGLTKDDVKVEFSDDALTIEGERRQENEKDGDYYRSERRYGKFYRRVALPEGVDPEAADATFTNGVLEVTMPAPKREPQKPRRLEISEHSKPKAKGKAA